MQTDSSFKPNLDRFSVESIILDENGVIRHVNGEWKKFADENGMEGDGYGLGTNYLEICEAVCGTFASYAHSTAQGILRVLDGKALTFELEYPCDSPLENRWFRLMAFPVKFADFDGVQVLHLNITDLVKRQQEHARDREKLRRSEQWFRDLADSMPLIVWTADAEGNVDYANRKFENYTGESLRFFPADRWREIVHTEDLPRCLELWEACVANGKTYETEYRIFCAADGQYHRHLVRAERVISGADGSQRWYGSAVDVQHMRQLEQEIYRKQRMDSIGTLAGGIAHDLNNLLTPMVMGLDLLHLVLKLPPEHADLIRDMQGNLNKSADLIRQLLTFARGGEGMRSTISFSKMEEEIRTWVKNTFPKNIQLETSCAGDLPNVVGDYTQIFQVLINLIVNARDAMPDGGAIYFSISVRTLGKGQLPAKIQGSVEPGTYVMIEVRDTGEGMSPEVRECIFEPFFTTKPLGKGTGLGLSTAFGILTGHKGFLRVESTPGEGSAFQVYLPVNSQSALLSEGDDEKSPAPVHDAKSRLILVVEDEREVREMTCKLLQAHGYRTLKAENGIEALNILKTNSGKIDLMLTDMMMPEMDGPTLIPIVRRSRPEMPIVATSGLDSGNQSVSARSLGVEYVLQKPCPSKDLLQMLERIFDSRPPVSSEDVTHHRQSSSECVEAPGNFT